jgi:mRNA interferase MazF
MVALMRRGEIWVARLNPNQGAEVDKLGPVVIVQADPITQAGQDTTVIVVPLTTQDRPGTRALRVPIRSRDRLLCDSYAMADQPRSPMACCTRSSQGPRQQQIIQAQVASAQQGKHRAGIAAADAELVIEHGDLEPGRKGLLHAAQPLEPAAAQLRAKPAAALKAHGNPLLALRWGCLQRRAVDRDGRFHGNAGCRAEHAGQPQQIHATPLRRGQQLQVFQPGANGQVGLTAAAPAQLPDSLELLQNPWSCQISRHRALQRLDQLLDLGLVPLCAAARLLAQQLQQGQALLGWVRGQYPRIERNHRLFLCLCVSVKARPVDPRPPVTLWSHQARGSPQDTVQGVLQSASGVEPRQFQTKGFDWIHHKLVESTA